MVSLCDTAAALQASTHPPNAEVLHALHSIAFISSLTDAQHFDVSAVEAKLYSLKLGLSLVRAGVVLHTYARMLAEVRAHTDDRSKCSSPKHDAMILDEALHLTTQLLSMTDCGRQERSDPLNPAKLRLRTELLGALAESALLEHMSAALLHLARQFRQPMQRDAGGDSSRAQGGVEAAQQQQQDDGVPSVVAVFPGLDFWKVLQSLERNSITIFNLMLFGRPRGAGRSAREERRSLLHNRLLALGNALLHGPCLHYLAAACICSELAARHGGPDFGTPHDSVLGAANGDFLYWDLRAPLVWPHAFDAPPPPQELLYRAVDAFLLF